MARSCTSCQHLKRSEIDRRLAEGEPTAQVARAYNLNLSSLHRHRKNCLRLAPSNEIKKEAARGTAAATLLPSKEILNGSYSGVITRIDEIVARAQAEGSLSIALDGLKAVRQTLDSQARLAGHTQAGGTQVNVAVQTNINVSVTKIAERLIQEFDHDPDIKERIARALREDDDEPKS
jgi:hypothetical protein